jgi:hypothetical protein
MSQEDPKICTTSGRPVDEHTRDIDAATGMQRDYVVLCPDERAKGYVRPLRKTYRHVGRPLKGTLRDLTPQEIEHYAEQGYVKFEEYPADAAGSPITGCFWRQADLDGRGCNGVTTMADSIAETYAVNPKFYGGTFCCKCRAHFPLEEFVWEGTTEVVGS